MSQWTGTRWLRIGMAQINTTVGDFTGNGKKILEAIDSARSLGIDLVTFPELAVCGYPPEDLLFKPQFIAENIKSLYKIADTSKGITAIIGFVHEEKGIYNAAAIVHNGKLAGIYHKIFLPNYGVFDEERYFKSGKECPVYYIAGIMVGVTICEDIWFDMGPAAVQAHHGAEVIVNISASPYYAGRSKVREDMITGRAKDYSTIFSYNNLIGGQDELVFDGGSLLIDEKGTLIARGKQFEEDFIVADLDIDSVSRARLDRSRKMDVSIPPEQPEWANVKKLPVSKASFKTAKQPFTFVQSEAKEIPGEVYDALVLGTHDYVRKNGFEKVLIGLSGGIDSSLVATIAVDALGNSNVIGVAMPSMYSSPGSISDAELLAKNLKIRLITVPIEKVFHAYLDMLSQPFEGTGPDITEENLQARIRGNILMAISNKFGWLVLNTGNKSEIATGYTTLYGDMAGGFAVIKDVPKTMVYELAMYRNSKDNIEVIPSGVLEKPPSAELRPDQKDSDSLPPYELLDPVLTAYVEEDKSIEQILASGIDEHVVKRAAKLVDTSEYKRRQAPPGVKITPRAFGKDRRLPITNRFKEW
jgi:NAD+ synthase (glutamine-hydrolysing)